jgi:hypothetical protein
MLTYWKEETANFILASYVVGRNDALPIERYLCLCPESWSASSPQLPLLRMLHCQVNQTAQILDWILISLFHLQMIKRKIGRNYGSNGATPANGRFLGTFGIYFCDHKLYRILSLGSGDLFLEHWGVGLPISVFNVLLQLLLYAVGAMPKETHKYH